MARDFWLTFPNGTEVELKETVSIGRDANNDLVMESPAVSREHAAIALRDGRWYLEDRGSFNGIGIGTDTLIFSWPTQVDDPDTTEPLEEVGASNGAQLSAFQRQVVQALCAPWLAGASLETLPSNEQIAAALGTPGATGTVKAALRRIYAKAGLSNEPAHAKRRALCRVARQNGWI
jgi:hypothetical protein